VALNIAKNDDFVILSATSVKRVPNVGRCISIVLWSCHVHFYRFIDYSNMRKPSKSAVMILVIFIIPPILSSPWSIHLSRYEHGTLRTCKLPSEVMHIPRNPKCDLRFSRACALKPNYCTPNNFFIFHVFAPILFHR
jgi:hypothetical protein